MAYPASPVPAGYATVTTQTRNNVFYSSDLNTTPPVQTVAWVVGSVTIKGS